MGWLNELRDGVSTVGEEVREGVRRTLPKVEGLLDDLDRRATKRKKIVLAFTPDVDPMPVGLVSVVHETRHPSRWAMVDLKDGRVFRVEMDSATRTWEWMLDETTDYKVTE